jgi:hypothetical protein
METRVDIRVTCATNNDANWQNIGLRYFTVHERQYFTATYIKAITHIAAYTGYQNTSCKLKHAVNKKSINISN